MNLGIFETIFPGGSVDERLKAVSEAGFTTVQFDLESAGLETLPPEISDDTITAVLAASNATGVSIAALHGTYNMIDPDPTVRREGTARLIQLIGAAPTFGVRIVTICTGTRNPQSMWRAHPDNQSSEAWRDLQVTISEVLPAAESAGVVLAIEPEPANVINTAPRARQFLDEMASPHLGIVADPANLLAGERETVPDTVIGNAFNLLGGDMVIAHGKDLDANGKFAPAGTGMVPWTRFVDGLRQANYEGAIILHSLGIPDIPRAVATLREAGVDQPTRPGAR